GPFTITSGPTYFGDSNNTWVYNGNFTLAGVNAHQGVGSAGIGTFSGTDGADWGLVSAAGAAGNLDGFQNAGATPFIKNSVQFNFTTSVAQGGSNTLAGLLNNTTFQYGTTAGTYIPPPGDQPTPEPATLVSLATMAIGFGACYAV